MSIYNIFTLLGGIALFLFGMNMMSNGLERAAGNKMRSILQALTKNRLIGTIVGIVITAIIQSSSAVTATVVSFVNAGLMNLTQSVGVIFGANIGTSVTGQLMAFKFDDFAPIIIAVSVVVYMFFKNDMAKKIAYIVLGFGILFLGMGMMKSGMSSLADSPMISNAIMSASNPIILIIIGLFVTAIIQSNSAMTGILIGMAATGLVTLDMTFYVILGSNIGACVTAVIASINGNRNSKRAALIHVLFNIIGTVVIGVILVFFEPQVESFILLLSPGDEVTSITRAVAMANTVFRVFNVLIMFPFANGLVKLTQLIIPVLDHSQEEDNMALPKFINHSDAFRASTALVETRKEFERVAKYTALSLEKAYNMLKNQDRLVMEEILKQEKNIDNLTDEIQAFLVKVTQMDLSSEDKDRLAGFFHVVIDIERIGDHAVNLGEFAIKAADEKVVFTEDAWKEMDELFANVKENLYNSIDAFINEDYEKVAQIDKLEDVIDDLAETCERNHIIRTSKGICSPKAGFYSEIAANLERVGDHANNIAFASVPTGMFLDLNTLKLIPVKQKNN